MKNVLHLISAVSLVLFFSLLVPTGGTYAKEEMHDNKYYCQRLDLYHMGSDKDTITSYCKKLLK